MTTSLQLVTEIGAPVEDVFDLSLNIDLHLVSMRGSGEAAIAGVTTGQIGLRERVTWRARHLGLVWTMTSEITEMDRPVSFVDEQVRGPFSRFRHVHRFVSSGDATLMIDDVTFAAPGGPLSPIVERLVLAPKLHGLLRMRNETILEAAATTGAGAS